MNSPLILVVDDEPSIREVVALYLNRAGYRVSTAADGVEAVTLAAGQPVDLVILDLMLPKIEGLEVFRRLRAVGNVPIIMLTARSSETDRIVGLELGADDYVVKPFSPRELVARVGAVLRRTNTDTPAVNGRTKPIESGELRVDPSARTVTVRGDAVSLTATEFDLLWFFASHPGQVFTRDQLLDNVWGYDFFGDASTVTVHVRRLREKIERDPAHPQCILTVWGVGYKFEVPEC
ncbi:MAG TPA: response regulator transcription factor [Ardenticatenaceae bacterium]|nr:response regulator transcription factor [Ardenticatenaceae bacterium]